MVGRVGFTACSISYIKKVCVFTGTHTITSLTVGIKHIYLYSNINILFFICQQLFKKNHLTEKQRKTIDKSKKWV